MSLGNNQNWVKKSAKEISLPSTGRFESFVGREPADGRKHLHQEKERLPAARLLFVDSRKKGQEKTFFSRSTGKSGQENGIICRERDDNDVSEGTGLHHPSSLN